jgi:hypothetical protein
MNHKDGSYLQEASSMSLGSSERDIAIDLELFCDIVHIERISTNGVVEKGAQLFKELEGEVDAF